MKGFDTLKVKSAVQARNEFDLSRSTLATMNFGEIIPLMVEETVPGDKIKVNAEFFSRLAPMVFPTYGKFSFRTVAGFVPYHQIADDADAWLAGKTVWEGQTPRLRYISYGNLIGFFNNYGSTTTNVTSSNCDYVYTNASGVVQYCKLTKYGKMCAKVLNALGYAIPENANFQTTSTWYKTLRTQPLNAMPLLAFFKLYNDYMSQSQRYNSSNLTDVLYKIKHGVVDSTIWTASSGSITTAGIQALFQNLKLNYDNDYFTSAWQNPNTPLNATESVNSVPIPGYPSGAFESLYNQGTDTTASFELGNQTVNVGQRVLDMLQRFDNWVRRNNYSGSRAVQQLYSRFGIKTDDYRSNYAHVISKDVMPVQVGDVTATADSQGAPLGDYAGKGIMSGSKGLEFSADDHGLFIILGYFTVNPMMSYGYDRRVLRTTPLDFYNPEFDGIGAEAISVGEVFENPLGYLITDTTSSDAVFGYTERYNSYRYGRDVIIGDFRSYRDDNEMNGWHTGRLLSDARAQGDLVAQSSTMNTLEQTDSQYNRMFSITSGDEDKFYLTCNFNVKAIRPMLNLNQVVRLGEGDTVVPRNGNVIS